MKQKHTIAVQDIASIVMALAILAFAGVLYAFVPRIDTFLVLKAKQDCASAYKYEYTDSTSHTVVTQPIKDLYNQCLSDKHISTGK